MCSFGLIKVYDLVALLTEGVDRNALLVLT